jgi:hypothetical protein
MKLEIFLKNNDQQKRLVEILSRYFRGVPVRRIASELKIHKETVRDYINFYKKHPDILRQICPDIETIQILMMQELIDIIKSPDLAPEKRSQIILDFFKLTGLKTFKIKPTTEKMKVVLWKDERRNIDEKPENE